jgi:hypothetical protein
VRGTSPEANGTIIKVYKGGTVTNNVVTGATLIGTGTVANGSWAVPVSAIALNDQIRATAAFTGTAPYTTNAAHNFFVEVTKLNCTALRPSTSVNVTVGTGATAPTTARAGADRSVCPPSFSLSGRPENPKPVLRPWLRPA